MTTFTSEAQFEQALIDELKNKGWDSQVLKKPDRSRSAEKLGPDSVSK